MIASAPNVVMIVLDDLGFAELGCYGSDIATPSIDQLGGEGLRYNSFHVTAICSSTRACLLTGRNHHAVGMGSITNLPMDLPGYTGRIPKSAATLPRLLRDAGYNTFAVGKWHLTPQAEEGAAGPFDRWPLGMGFERFYGFLGGMTNQWTPTLVRDNTFVEPPATPDEGYHVTEDLASQAIRFVQDQQQAAPDQPFFLYFATGAPHTPQHVASQWVEPYRGRFDAGWEALRNRVFERQRQLDVVPPRTVLTDRPAWVARWADLPVDERRLYARQMEVYAGFMTHTDAQIGRLIDFLARAGVVDDTIIMVLSDNGASAEGGPHGFFNMRQIDRRGDDVVADNASRIDEIGGFRSFNHYAWGWAWAGNTPFRLWKRYSWLGGVRVPLIVHWPTGIPDDSSGQIRPQFVHAVDVMPTILDAVGIEAPATVGGVTQQPIDGRSLLATLTDPDAPSPRTTQYFETYGSRAIYHDGWKATTDYVSNLYRAERELIGGSDSFDTDRWQLVHLDEDFSEAHDLAHAEPDRVRQMVDLWHAEANRNQVLPLVDGASLMNKQPDPGRNRFELFPDGGRLVIPSLVAGFRLTADVEVPERRSLSGVISAHGDWNGGWACYAPEGHLAATFTFGDVPRRIVSREPITPGRHDVGVAYVPGTEGDGWFSMTIDGSEVGGEPVSAERWGWLAYLLQVDAHLLIGRDRGFPVCDDYQPPSPFNGRLGRVVFEVATALTSPDPQDAIDRALRHD